MTIISDIQQFNDQELSFAMLLRRFCDHEWLLPSIEEQPILQTIDEQLFLSLSSTKETFSQAHTDLSIKAQRHDMQWLLDNLPEETGGEDQLAGILIDIGTEHAMQIPAQYFPVLQQIYACHQVENLFTGSPSQEEFIETLKNYPSFLLPLLKDEEGTLHIALAPDNQNRQLVAVFTAPDCFRAFQTAAQGKLGEMTVDEVSGEKLFADLATLPIDGLVFNCYGPVEPKALGKDLITAISSTK